MTEITFSSYTIDTTELNMWLKNTFCLNTTKHVLCCTFRVAYPANYAVFTAYYTHSLPDRTTPYTKLSPPPRSQEVLTVTQI